MAKKNVEIPTADIKGFLSTLKKLPPVYDAKDFTNRPFTLTNIEWLPFEASAKNNYNPSTKLTMHITLHSDGREALVETTQRGIVEIINALDESGLIPCDVMIVQEGKYCTVVAV